MGNANHGPHIILLKDRGAPPWGSAPLSSSLEWSGSLVQGQSITISTDGTYDFGSKAQASPVIWDMVDEHYANGVLTPHANFGDGNLVIDDDAYSLSDPVTFSTANARNARKPYSFYADCSPINGSVQSPVLTSPTAFDIDTQRISNDHKVYAARRFYISKLLNLETVDRLYADPWSESTAYAQDDLRSWKGVQDGGSQTGTGSDLIYEAQNSGTSGASEPVWPDESTAIIGTTTFTDNDITWLVVGRSSSSTKFGRIWDNPAGTGTRASWTYTQLTSLGSFTNQSGNLILAAGWHLLEMFASNTTGVVQVYVDGSLHLEATDFIQGDTNYQLYFANFGFEQNGSGPNLVEVNYGEIYSDRTGQRVVFGNASTYAACTEYIYQRPTAWTDNSITCVVSDDSNSLSGSWFAYIIDSENDVINSSGLVL